MENFLIYLLKASVGIVLFYLFYILVLRKETFYMSNRWYLIVGLLLAVLLPAFPVSYVSSVVMDGNSSFFSPVENQLGTFLPTNESNKETSFWWSNPILLISAIYIVGMAFFALRLGIQTISVFIKLRHGKSMLFEGVKVVDIKRNVMPFSFFNAVVININEYSKEELSNIIAHEKVHIQERHWVDLLIIELLTVVFWINPIVWLYERSIKQNHEYLADQGVLLAGYNPGQYQALLINQLMGVNILGFTNNLNFSLNKKRMEMMKKEKSPGFNRVKLLIVLPVIAVLIVAFAKPEYVMEDNVDNSVPVQSTIAHQEFIPVKGTVKDKDGNPLTGASIILKNTSNGTVVDRQGEFRIEIPNGGTLVTSFVGYKTVTTAVSSTGSAEAKVKIEMEKGVFNIDLSKVDVAAWTVNEDPPPPPPQTVTTKDEMFTIVENMPSYKQGGMNKLAFDIQNEVKWVTEKTKDRGEVTVGFTVLADGRIANPQVVKSAGSEMLDASAVKIIKKLDNWNPGNQRGKKVPVDLTVPIKFN